VPELASLTGRSQCIWDRENQWYTLVAILKSLLGCEGWDGLGTGNKLKVVLWNHLPSVSININVLF
jgi:hypothetical protein